MEQKNRKCIAVIISKPERRYQEGLLAGVCRYAFSHDINVAVFATTLMEGSEEHLWGETNIFDLIRFERFAGIIYAIDTFYGHEYTKLLNEKIKQVAASGIPAVTIDGKVEGLPCFYNDDTNAIKDVLIHLIREHQVHDIAYMTGHKGHPHAENALHTYREVMAQFGLPILSERTYYGDYWYNEAERFVEKLSESEDGLPEAIVCANEHMAIGVYKALYARGIFVPKQIRLACTSNDASAAPYLLINENSAENASYAACEALLSAADHASLPPTDHHVPSKNTLLPSVSCGCHRTSEYDYSKERGVMVDTGGSYFGEFNFYRDEIISKKSYRSLFRRFDASLYDIAGFRGLYFCMCDGWDDPLFLIHDTRKNPYPETMQLYYSHEELPDGPRMLMGKERSFPAEEMFPALFDGSGDPSLYIFRSLHFMDRNFGYVVLDNAQSSKVYDYTFNFWLRDVANALEAQCRLQSVNYMHYTDIMTGVYNRNGFNNMLDTVLEEAVSNGQQILIALADMNGLKSINDTYGHEEGDVAIKASAALLKKQTIPCAISERNFRIGGDEFVKIAVGSFDEKVVQEFKDALYASVEAFSSASGKPYKTQMSIGICYDSASRIEEIDALLSMADKRMYAEKQRLKDPSQTSRS